jgi:transcriptional regulator with XRE-family HTH domain
MNIEITVASNPLADLFAQPPSAVAEAEALKVAFADGMVALMKQNGVTKAELARRMGAHPSRVTALLSGTSNLTIDTMVRAARAVGASLHQKLLPAGKKVRWQEWDESEVHPTLVATTRMRPKACTKFINLPKANSVHDRTAA